MKGEPDLIRVGAVLGKALQGFTGGPAEDQLIKVRMRVNDHRNKPAIRSRHARIRRRILSPHQFIR